MTSDTNDFKRTPTLTIHSVRSPSTPPSPPDSYGQEPGIPIHTTVTTITLVCSVKNPEVHRTSPRSSPSPPSTSTCPGNRGPVTHTTPVTIIDTTLWGDQGFTRCDDNRHRRYSTDPVTGPGIHRPRAPTIDITIVVQPTQVRVRGVLLTSPWLPLLFPTR